MLVKAPDGHGDGVLHGVKGKHGISRFAKSGMRVRLWLCGAGSVGLGLSCPERLGLARSAIAMRLLGRQSRNRHAIARNSPGAGFARARGGVSAAQRGMPLA